MVENGLQLALILTSKYVNSAQSWSVNGNVIGGLNAASFVPNAKLLPDDVQMDQGIEI